MKSIGLALFVLFLVAGSPVRASGIYHWVDENGVSHYTQSAPPAGVKGVSVILLDDTRPPDYDPAEDRYGIQAQAERMASLREEMAERRETYRENRRDFAPQPVAPYPQPYPYVYPSYLRPPHYPRPPVRPEHPIAVPYPTVTLRPAGSGYD